MSKQVKNNNQNKTKNLTLTDINKLNKQYNEQFEVTLQDQYKIKIDKKFKRTKIQKIIIELQEVIEELRQKDVTINTIQDILSIYQMLILKHFTSLPLPQNISIEKMLAVCEKLIDTGLFEEIWNSFPQEQIEFLGQEVDKYVKNIPQIGEQLGEMFVGMDMGNENVGEDVEGNLEQIENEINDNINKDKLN